MPAENVPMGRASLCYGILKGARDMLLPDHFGEFLRTVFAGENLVAHVGGDGLIIRDGAKWEGRGSAVTIARG